MFNIHFIDNVTSQDLSGSWILEAGANTNIGNIILNSYGPLTVSGNIGKAGVMFTGTNTEPSSLTTDVNGDWLFTVVDGDEVTITPSKEGYCFDPEFFYVESIDQSYNDFVFSVSVWAPDAPINPYPSDGATGVSFDLPCLWWEAPESGVAPTSYIVTLADNAEFASPFIDSIEVSVTVAEIPTALLQSTTYYAKVTPCYSPPASQESRIASRASGDPLIWSFHTYAEGENAEQNAGFCNGTDPVVINLPSLQVRIDPIAGVASLVIVDFTLDPEKLYELGSPGLPLVITSFLFGLDIDAGDPSNLNGTIELDVGPGFTITDLFYHNEGDTWQEFTSPAAWNYNDVTGIISITGLNLLSRTGGDIEIIAHEMTLNFFFRSLHASFNPSEGSVLLKWVTESESDMMGYNILRSQEDNFYTATFMNDSIIPAGNQSSSATYEVVDNSVYSGDYYYWIQAIENNGYAAIYGPVAVTIPEPVPTIPEFTVLSDAYPNPFNPKTTIKFSVAKQETAKLTIYNVLGQVVKNYPAFSTGSYKLEWSGTDNNDNPVGSGIYFYRLETESYKKINKMLLLK